MTSTATHTNVVLVLADDLGFSDLGCYGGEIPTPHLDRLAQAGVRMTQFYNTARCSPSRASLLTGKHPHETGIGVLTDDGRPTGYPGSLDVSIPTMAEHLARRGYRTCLAGKWHLSEDIKEPNETWPTRRGFEEFYGILGGAGDYFRPRGLHDGEQRLPVPEGDYYFTDEVTTRAVEFVQRSVLAGAPFFLYLAYTAPHWPLHAPEDVVVAREPAYRDGWDAVRERRAARLTELGLLGAEAELTPGDRNEPAWDDLQHPEWEARRMAVYAAQVEAMDAGVGRLLDALEDGEVLDDTLIIFLSDNGACAEELPPADAPHFRERNPSHTVDGREISIGNEPGIWPGGEDTFSSYGRAWANVSNTPFRLYKRWVHEGGISTPLIAHWTAGGLRAGIHRTPFQLTDVLPAVLAATGRSEAGRPGRLLDSWRGHDVSPERLCWEHIGNAAVRQGRWKAVKESGGEWELYDMDEDRSELNDLASVHDDVVREMAQTWQEWADDVGVIPWDRIKEQGR